MSNARITQSLAESLGIDPDICPIMYKAAREHEKLQQHFDSLDKAVEKQAKADKQKAKKAAEEAERLKRQEIEEKRKQKNQTKAAKESELQREKEAKLEMLRQKLRSKSNRNNNKAFEQDSTEDLIDNVVHQKNLLSLKLNNTTPTLKRAKIEPAEVYERLSKANAKLAEIKNDSEEGSEVVANLEVVSQKLSQVINHSALDVQISNLLLGLINLYEQSSETKTPLIAKNLFYLRNIYKGLLQFQAFALKIKTDSDIDDAGIKAKNYVIDVLQFLIASSPQKEFDYKNVLTVVDCLIRAGRDLQKTPGTIADYLEFVSQDLRAKVEPTVQESSRIGLKK